MSKLTCVLWFVWCWRQARTTVDVNVSDLFEELEKAAVAEQQQVLPSTELPDASPKSRSRGNSRTASRGSASASGSKALDAAKRSLRNTLLRWNTPLQAFYEHYATLCAESGDGGDGNNFTMSLNEFWKFVKACDIPSPQFTIADINRIFLRTCQWCHVCAKECLNMNAVICWSSYAWPTSCFVITVTRNEAAIV